MYHIVFNQLVLSLLKLRVDKEIFCDLFLFSTATPIAIEVLLCLVCLQSIIILIKSFLPQIEFEGKPVKGVRKKFNEDIREVTFYTLEVIDGQDHKLASNDTLHGEATNYIPVPKDLLFRRHLIINEKRVLNDVCVTEMVSLFYLDEDLVVKLGNDKAGNSMYQKVHYP